MITTTSFILWYLCIGGIIAMRAWTRVKPYLPELLKKVEKDEPNDTPFASETLVLLAVGIGVTLTWPLLLFKITAFYRLMFTNKYPFKKGALEVK